MLARKRRRGHESHRLSGRPERHAVQPEAAEPGPQGDPLAAAGREDVCFVENLPLAPWAAAIERLTVYRWNRVYPADMRLDLALDRGWHLVAASDFPGFSHEKITKEIYER